MRPLSRRRGFADFHAGRVSRFNAGGDGDLLRKVCHRAAGNKSTINHQRNGRIKVVNAACVSGRIILIMKKKEPKTKIKSASTASARLTIRVKYDKAAANKKSGVWISQNRLG
jgi:hypothetical protein